MAEEFEELQEQYAEFLSERDWEQFHTPQTVAMALSVEANELLECFLWHDNISADVVAQDAELMQDIEDEVADIIIYTMSMAIQLDIDLLDAVQQKLEQNENRFDAAQAATIRDRLGEWQRE